MRRASESSESPDTHAYASFEMRSAAAMRGAPFAECFAVASIVRVSRRSGERTGAAVEVSCAIDWKKPVNGLLRGLIVKGARDSLKRSYEKFTAMRASSREVTGGNGEPRAAARAFRRGRARSTDAFPGGPPSTEASSDERARRATDTTREERDVSSQSLAELDEHERGHKPRSAP